MTTKTITIKVNEKLCKIAEDCAHAEGYNNIEDLINVLLHHWVEKGWISAKEKQEKI